MGYYTHFYGKIKFHRRYKKLIEYLIKNDVEPFFSHYNIYVTEEDDYAVLNFGVDIKNYENDVENICQFLVFLDKNAEGTIECYGDERDDLWAIKVEDGKVKILEGRVLYNFGCYFEDKEIKKRVKEILSDEKIKDEILIESL